MAGGTKSYKVTLDEHKQPVKELVSYHPRYALRPSVAVNVLREDDTAYVHVAPPDWQEFMREWNRAATTL